MKSLTVVFLLVAIGLVSGQGGLDPSTTAKATTAKTTTTKATTPKPTTAKTTTPKPTTAKTTTAKPTTANTTTAKPTTAKTTTAKPTAAPTPKPEPFGDYSVKKDDKYCLLAQMEAMFMVTYKAGNITKKVTIEMPKNGSDVNTSMSKCGAEPKLVIAWKKFYKFSMDFKNGSEWEVSKVMFTAITKGNKDFNGTDETILLQIANHTELGGLKAGAKGYYACDANRTYPLQGNTTGHMVLNYVKLQPFGVKPDKDKELFGTEYNCIPPTPTAAPTPDNNIVPIAVGCALAGLVLIVLIAYIIGRRKSQRGYEKV